MLLIIGNGVDHLESIEYYKKLLNMAVLAGSIMISSGAETHRVEDTLHRILATSNFEHADAFVFTTGMVVTLSDPSGETLSISHRVTDTSRNFGRIADVNSVSRDFCNGQNCSGLGNDCMFNLASRRCAAFMCRHYRRVCRKDLLRGKRQTKVYY